MSFLYLRGKAIHYFSLFIISESKLATAIGRVLPDDVLTIRKMERPRCIKRVQGVAGVRLRLGLGYKTLTYLSNKDIDPKECLVFSVHVIE